MPISFRVERGLLEDVMDPKPLPTTAAMSYGNRRFYVPPDVDIELSAVLCDSCSEEFENSSAGLHRECAIRLRKALAGVRTKPRHG